MDQLAKRIAAIAHEADFDGITQGDAGRIEIDLNGARLTGLWIELNVREAGADDKKRVAVLHGFHGRRGAKQANSTGGVRTFVRDARFTEKRFDDRRAESFGQL